MNRFGLCSFPVRSQYREPESVGHAAVAPGLESALARNEDRCRAASAVRRARARERESQQSAESRTEAGVGLVTRPSVRRTPGPHTNTSAVTAYQSAKAQPGEQDHASSSTPHPRAACRQPPAIYKSLTVRPDASGGTSGG